jgi:hypothetical protein
MASAAQTISAFAPPSGADVGDRPESDESWEASAALLRAQTPAVPQRPKPQVLLMLPSSGAMHLLMTGPGPCGTCRTMTIMFANRLGRTQCERCDSVEAAHAGRGA